MPADTNLTALRARIEDALRRGFLAGAGLRREDAQKAAELAPLLGEIARLGRRKAGVLVDACAGKGAAGVLALSLVLGDGWRVVALEREPRFAARLREGAARLGVAGRVDVVTSDVAEAPWPDAPDVVVALHACGGATDAVLDRAMAANARAIVAVPCCYAGGPKHAAPSGVLRVPGDDAVERWRRRVPLPGHGLVGRRFAEAIIDAERTLRLESRGWETEVVELFSPTVSPYNRLWRARRVGEPVRSARALEQWRALTGA